MFCIGYDSNVYWEYLAVNNWVWETLPSTKWSSTSSGLAAVTRTIDNIDVLWIDADGSVKGQGYYADELGYPYPVADPGSAWSSSIVAVSRDIDKIDVWWIGRTGLDNPATNPYLQH
jgi:hypothetical protein